MDECNSRFCGVNVYIIEQPATAQPTVRKIVAQKTVVPKFDGNRPSRYQVQPLQIEHEEEIVIPNPRIPAVDRNQLNRNRLLRQQLDAKREADIEAEEYQEFKRDQRRKAEMEAARQMRIPASPSTGPPEAIKIRLLMMLRKFRDLSFEYKYLSQYFEACFKTSTASGIDNAVLESFLIFDKADLQDSPACYAAALRGIDRTTTTKYTSLGATVDGLATILKDLQ